MNVTTTTKIEYSASWLSGKPRFICICIHNSDMSIMSKESTTNQIHSISQQFWSKVHWKNSEHLIPALRTKYKVIMSW